MNTHTSVKYKHTQSSRAACAARIESYWSHATPSSPMPTQRTLAEAEAYVAELSRQIFHQRPDLDWRTLN